MQLREPRQRSLSPRRAGLSSVIFSGALAQRPCVRASQCDGSGKGDTLRVETAGDNHVAANTYLIDSRLDRALGAGWRVTPERVDSPVMLSTKQVWRRLSPAQNHRLYGVLQSLPGAHPPLAVTLRAHGLPARSSNRPAFVLIAASG